VIPGVYTLKLTVDGQVYTRTVTVVNDPRVGQSPELMAALRSQNRLTLLAVHGMEETFAGHDEVEAVWSQIAALSQSAPPETVAAQAKALVAELVKIGGVTQGGFGGGGRGRGPVDPKALASFADLNNDYNTMVSMMQVGLDMAPTPTQIATWESACPKYNRTVDAWKAMQGQLADFNAVLTKSGLPTLKLTPTALTEGSCSFMPAARRAAK
jgi:hypothetical protein